MAKVSPAACLPQLAMLQASMVDLICAKRSAVWLLEKGRLQAGLD
jgi:hypothetical protein